MKYLHKILYYTIFIIFTSACSRSNINYNKTCSNKSVIEFGKSIIETSQLQSFIVVFPPEDSIDIVWNADTAVITSTYYAYGLDSTAILTSEYQLYLLCKNNTLLNLGKSETFEMKRIEN